MDEALPIVWQRLIAGGIAESSRDHGDG